MATDPYAPPSAELADPPSRPWARWAAVLVGLLVDVGGSVLIATIVGIGLGIYLASLGMNPKEIGESLTNWTASPSVIAASAIFGALFSILGGWLCTRLARSQGYKLAIVLSVLSSACGFLIGGRQYTLPTHLFFVALTFASVLLGARFAMRRK